MIQVNRDDRMASLYKLYWDVWSDINPDVTVLFNMVEEPNDYGDFGLKYHYEDTDAPKWNAIMDIIN